MIFQNFFNKIFWKILVLLVQNDFEEDVVDVEFEKERMEILLAFLSIRTIRPKNLPY